MKETIHKEASRYGIEKPELERREYIDENNVLVTELTPDSEREWSEYLRNISLARIAFYKASQ